MNLNKSHIRFDPFGFAAMAIFDATKQHLRLCLPNVARGIRPSIRVDGKLLRPIWGPPAQNSCKTPRTPPSSPSPSANPRFFLRKLPQHLGNRGPKLRMCGKGIHRSHPAKHGPRACGSVVVVGPSAPSVVMAQVSAAGSRRTCTPNISRQHSCMYRNLQTVPRTGTEPNCDKAVGFETIARVS